MPPDIGHFIGRTEVLEQLTGLLVPAETSTSIPIVTVVGPPGVGKTALAVHIAHQLGDAFPDGRLFANLHGYSRRSPMTATQALTQFLRTLGVPAEQIPLDVEEQSILFRSLLSGKRVLVVLDNAASAERINAEPGAATELASLCGYLPLALSIAAANQSLGSIAEYVTELSHGSRLARLAVDDDDQAAVGSAFDLSYAALKPEAGRLFRLLGLTPGPDLTAETAAVLADVDAADAEELLRRLATGTSSNGTRAAATSSTICCGCLATGPRDVRSPIAVRRWRGWNPSAPT